MPLVLTLAARDHASLQGAMEMALEGVAAAGALAAGSATLSEGALDIFIEGDDAAGVKAGVARALERQAVDFCVQGREGRRKRLLIADMDSTIIGCECLDELADFAGLKAEIAAITERAMAGEIDFEAALRERVGMLKGLELGALQQTYDQRVRLNPGAERLIRTMTAHGARCVLVSGGFEFFTARVAALAGFDDHRANRLLDDGARLTGAVADPILGREAKLAALRAEAERLGIGLAAAVAVGDGANDLAMIEAAGLGVAYRAKPIVAAQADAAVNYGGLETLLYFQGFGADEFV